MSRLVPGGSGPPDPPKKEARKKPKKTSRPSGMYIPPDSVQRATTQMLPGRLQPEDPSVVQQEIRFIRLPGDDQVVTLGWKIGDPPAHITLNHRSVQPVHARLTFREGNWWLENLADFDPLIVNDKLLKAGDKPRLLEDGDRIRIGEIVFRFFIP